MALRSAISPVRWGKQFKVIAVHGKEALVKKVPLEVRAIMETLAAGGFQCYLVGGCVRDLLLFQTPTDYDFVTDRLPEEIKAAAAAAGWKAWEHEVSFGIVNLVVGNASYEVATMRAETYGADPHRPENVEFLQDIMLDLSRRDFTINAMALDLQGEIIDPFDGRLDLEKKRIRSVGEARERFLEDPLRLMRAPRLSARTGFEVDPALLEAARDVAVRRRFKKLSVERVRDELEKILLSTRPHRGLRILQEAGALEYTCTGKTAGKEIEVPLLPEISRLENVRQNPRFHRYDALEHTLLTVARIRPEITLRWAALLHDVAKGTPGVRRRSRQGEVADYGHARKGAEMTRVILERLRVPRAVSGRAAWLVRHHMGLGFEHEQAAARWLKRRAREFPRRDELQEAVEQLYALARADDLARGGEDVNLSLRKSAALLQRILEKMVLYPQDLAISGDYIAGKMGGPGPPVGKVLQDLLVDVQSGRLENKPEVLQKAVRKKARRLEGNRS